MIELKDLSKVYKTSEREIVALDGINLTIQDGEIFGIIGLSGAGKSTLVRCINLLERPTGGEVIIDGKSLTELPRRELLKLRQQIGMIFQGFNLLEQRNVIKNICFPLELAGVKKEDAQARALELLKLVGLEDRASSYPSQLSGGQKQRVAIAGIIALRPDVIIFDEATAMLDPRGRADVLSTIEKLNRDFGTTVIHITHYMEEAIRADRVIVIDDGKIKLDGTPREVFSEVEAVKSAGLDVPQVTELMLAVKNDGFDIPTDVLTFTEGADAVEAYILQRTDKKDHS